MSILSLAAQVAPVAPETASAGGVDLLIVAFLAGAILTLVFLGVLLRGNEDFDDLAKPGAD